MNQESLNLSAEALNEYNRQETVNHINNFTRYCLNELTHVDHLKYIYNVLPN